MSSIKIFCGKKNHDGEFFPKNPEEWLKCLVNVLRERGIFQEKHHNDPGQNFEKQSWTTPQTFLWIKALCCGVLGWTKTQWFLRSQENLSPMEQKLFRDLWSQLKSLPSHHNLWAAPLGRFLGYGYFLGRRFFLNQSTLEPRPETELLISLVQEYFFSLKKNHYDCSEYGAYPKKILDLGTGSGCLLTSLLHEFPEALGVGIDCSSGALAMAHHNAVYHDMEYKNNSHADILSRIFWIKGHWGNKLKRKSLGRIKFSCIVSNPPYIEDYLNNGEYFHGSKKHMNDPKNESQSLLLDPQVYHWDPKKALFGGLKPYKTIVPLAYELLEPKGLLAVEIGWNQKDAVVELFQRHNFQHIEAHKDHNDFWRCISGVR